MNQLGKNKVNIDGLKKDGKEFIKAINLYLNHNKDQVYLISFRKT